MLDKLHILISVFAATVVLIVSIVLSSPLLDTLVRLIITIIMFYFAGVAVKYYLLKKVFWVPEELTEETDELEEENMDEFDDEMSEYADK